MKPTAVPSIPSNLVPLLAAVILAGCASHTSERTARAPVRDAEPVAIARAPGGPGSSATTVNAYKREAALHISNSNAGNVYSGRPQALLRSVIVMKYTIDAQGRVIRSEIIRSNHDDETEAIAMRSLRAATPLPRPSARLLSNGQLDVIETWLFNDDGRFQLRTIAQPQMDS